MRAADVVAVGVSAAVGVAVFSVTAPATKIAGPAMLVGLAIAVLPMGVFAVVYAFLGAAVPRSGSSYDWPARFVHPYMGFLVTWLRIFGNAGALHIMAVVFVSYLSKLVAFPAGPTMLLLFLVFYVTNLVGVSVAGRVAIGLVILKVAVLGLFIVAGLPHVTSRYFVPLAPHGAAAVLAALPLLIGLYGGVESAAEVGEEIRNTRRVVGRGIAAATLIGMMVYLGTSVVTIGTLGPDAVAASASPLIDAGKLFLGAWGSPLLVITALAAIAAAVNAIFLIFSRFLFAMGRDGAMPRALARIHPRWGTPHVAITVTFVIGALSLFLPDNLVFLFLAANLPTVLKYFCNCWAAARLVDRHRELYDSARVFLSPRAVKGWAYTGMVCAALILASGWNADWRSYAALFAWGGIGSIYWLVVARHASLSMRSRLGGASAWAE